MVHRFANGVQAVKGVNWQIQKGEFIVLSGSNGSGKTVLVRHFNGLLQPTSGSVLLWGKPVSRQLLIARQTIGLVFQDAASQMVAQTVYEEVAFGPENLRLTASEINHRVTQALQTTGLTGLENRHPLELSGGQQRRLAIAGILAMQPAMIVLDEPFNGLDYEGVVQTLQQIVSLHQNGHTILVITHDLEKTLAHATRLAIMHQGQMVLDGTPQTVLPQAEKYGVKPPYHYHQRPLNSITWLT
ncbi:MAG TPA: ABC transporter ATP-binding protein [Chitinophagales bacterium]|nr:ABC transporter ATP-binding protein [Chitinophagales bacterium]